MNLNVKDWKEFYVDRIFIKPKILKYPAMPETEGAVPFVSSTSENNGVALLCDEKPSVSKCITVSTNGNCFDCFYHNEPICVSNDVEVLVNEELTTLQMLFICSILKQESEKYNYGRKAKNGKVWNTIIKLPIQHYKDDSPVIDNQRKYHDKGYIPDWQFMEDYMKSLHYKPLKTTRANCSKLELNVKDWKEYRINKLFTVVLSKGDIKADEINSGTVRLVSSGENNNGIVAYIDHKGDGKAEIFENNTITVDMFCNAFYQNKPFYAVSHGRVNMLLPKFKLNPYIGLFISTLINNEKYKYSYGRALYSNVVSSMVLKLPTQYNKFNNNLVIDKNKTYSNEGYIPDWQFMEDYISRLPYSDKIL